MESTPLQVLAVEDCQEDRERLSRMVQKRHLPVEIEFAETLEQAQQFLARQRVDAVLLDLGLDRTTGLETLRSFRELVPDLPVIVLSGVEDHEVAVAAVQDGAQDYLFKGEFNPSTLLRSIHYAVERQQLLARLRASEERYALAAAGANDGLWDWNLVTNEIYYSPRWKMMLGFSSGEISSDPEEWFKRVHPDDVDRLKEEINLHLKGVVSHFEHEFRIRHKDGSYRWMLGRGVAVRNANGTVTRIVGSQTDVTRRKLAEAKLLFEAHHDSLTLLPNRAQLLRRLSRMLEQGKRRSDQSFALLYVDFDRFKLVNDSLGHSAGDELLMALARRLTDCVRPGDMVARLGGDEFAILLEEIRDVSDALRVAGRVHEVMRNPVVLYGHETVISASVGIAIWRPSYDEADDLLRDADVAMYRAKSQGRGRSVVFDSTMHEQAVATLRMESELRSGLTRKEFRMYYQPIICLRTEKILGFEALMRWQHPRRGLVMPGEFIPMAEETGLIHPLGLWTLEETCRQATQWKEQFPDTRLAVNVNLSATQIADLRLVDQMKTMLQETEFDPRRLVLRVEITESALMDHAEAVPPALIELKKLGIQLCIDDFGIGYSSLSYLHRLPVDMLKIDRSFVSRLDVGGENCEIVRTIIVLAHSVGLQVVAEGIERYEHVIALRSMHCEYGQGYLYSRPVSAEEATKLLEFERETRQPVSRYREFQK